MTKDEFVELHGEEAWNSLVRPVQEYAEGCTCHRCMVQRNNANVLAHTTVGQVLRLLGIAENTLKGAQKNLACGVQSDEEKHGRSLHLRRMPKSNC